MSTIVEANLVGGRFTAEATGEPLEVRNPANGELVGRVPAMGVSDLEARGEVGKTAEFFEAIVAVNDSAYGLSSAVYTRSLDAAFRFVITEAMAQDVRAAGCQVRLGHEVTGISLENERVRVVTPVSEDVFDRLIVCAGLQSDVVARFVGANSSPKILPFRGEYWELAASRTDLVKGMIYPVPDPRFPRSEAAVMSGGGT